MVSNLDVAKKLGKDTLYAAKKIVKGTPKVTYQISKGLIPPLILGTFALPTCIRRSINYGDTDDPRMISYLFGAGFGFSFLVCNVNVLFPFNFNPLLPYNTDTAKIILATSLATNVASGIYELFRFYKNKMASTSPTSTPTTSPLEQKVEEPKPKPKRDIPNPWDIDIPKIEYIRRNQ